MLYFKLVEGKTPQPKKVEMHAIFVHACRVMFSPPNLDGTYVQCLLRQLGYRALLELPKHALDLFFLFCNVSICFCYFGRIGESLLSLHWLGHGGAHLGSRSVLKLGADLFCFVCIKKCNNKARITVLLTRQEKHQTYQK